jgi:septum formation protein
VPEPWARCVVVIAISTDLKKAPRVVLASGSLARANLLQSAGLRFETHTPDVDEVSIMKAAFDQGATTEAALIEIAKAKVKTVTSIGESTLVVAADSMLEFEGELIGKPKSKEDVVARWSRLRGSSAQLITAHVMRLLPAGRIESATETSRVNFANITDDELARYAATSEPLMAAGAFTLEGLGSAFVESIEGSASNVQGLSLPLLRLMARKLGIEWVDLWADESRMSE